MPFPNEHAARQKEPKGYTSFRRGKPKGFPEGVNVIFGMKVVNGSRKSEIQSIRFDKKKWSVDRAKKWLKNHDFKTSIEPAKKETKMIKKANIYKATVPMMAQESIANFTKKLNNSGQEYLRSNLNLVKNKSYIWLSEAFSSSAIFRVEKYEDHKLKYYGLTFKRDKNGKFEFASPIEVERYTVFKPVNRTIITKETLWD
jgi:hypothetical protein